MPRIFLHVCCGPCLLYPVDRLREQGWTVHAYFYNPHIQPYQELVRRIEALEKAVEHKAVPLILRRDYELQTFLRQVVYREETRCLYCYSRRLEATARLAKKSRFDAFTTTLLYSKRQKHEQIRSIALNASKKWGIPFHYEDFRIGWRNGQTQSRQLELYRQQYCGCIFSERERFVPKSPKPRL